jgi:hypothetical protein
MLNNSRGFTHLHNKPQHARADQLSNKTGYLAASNAAAMRHLQRQEARKQKLQHKPSIPSHHTRHAMPGNHTLHHPRQPAAAAQEQQGRTPATPVWAALRHPPRLHIMRSACLFQLHTTERAQQAIQPGATSNSHTSMPTMCHVHM